VTTILAIDPGTTRSGWIQYAIEEQRPVDFGIDDNAVLISMLRAGEYIGPVVIEQVASYGMPLGSETLETVYWSGRFAEACRPVPVHRLTRLAIKSHLCHSGKANDATIRQALIDRFGGKERAIGRKASPGPLYGIHADLWAALAVAVTWADQNP
jgi:hypothetical protein